jgi:hypothetical protein
LVECWDFDYQTKRVVVPNLTHSRWGAGVACGGPQLDNSGSVLSKGTIYVVEEIPGFKGYIWRDVNPEQSKRVVYGCEGS